MWNRIWAVLSDFFVEVGCHRNLQVAMYAVDSLRQLAMKFLERDELANYSFQNDFLKPFVVVMRQSKAVEIRELIIRRAPPISELLKSGWDADRGMGRCGLCFCGACPGSPSMSKFTWTDLLVVRQVHTVCWELCLWMLYAGWAGGGSSACP